ncbi:hypothetical protein CPLU01_06786 [Colletotrichum plurivorum]|uniref:Uncharacterized protein n=1 Tax=Colletotrichum plurivorum TaxID=2175906 RepID=A0A8H6KH49_9PEZI|nr:hypothetical protein CPLU01_06786 [Colletotrichum plurivorum]
MLFNNLAPAALALCALLAPALAAPQQVEYIAPEDGALDADVANLEIETVTPGTEGLFAREEDKISRRADDITLQFYHGPNCPGGGPHRSYSKNACISLSESTKGLRIIRGPPRCTLRTYEDNRCTKTPRIITTNGCYDMRKRWSVKVVC